MSTNQSSSEGRLGREPAPFDLDRLRLRQDFDAMAGVRREIVTVPVRRPHRQVWMQVHPDEQRRFPVALLELSETRETYLVHPDLAASLAGEWTPKQLFSCVTLRGDFFFWPIKLADENGRLDPWNESALRIATGFPGEWIRVLSNQHLGSYEVRRKDLPDEPQWPDRSFEELLRIAFPPSRVIDNLNHPVVAQLGGGA